MKAKFVGCLLFLLGSALALTVSARPGGKAQPRSANAAADRSDSNRDDRDTNKDRDRKDADDKHDRDDRTGDRDGAACRSDDVIEHSRRTPLQVVGVIPIPERLRWRSIFFGRSGHRASICVGLDQPNPRYHRRRA